MKDPSKDLGGALAESQAEKARQELYGPFGCFPFAKNH